MADVKMTKRDKFEAIAEVLVATGADATLVEFVAKEVAMLVTKASAPRTKTPAQRENDDFKVAIVDMLAGTEGMTATAIGAEMGFSVQKASALLKQLVADGTVVRTEGEGEDKGKTNFTVA